MKFWLILGLLALVYSNPQGSMKGPKLKVTSTQPAEYSAPAQAGLMLIRGFQTYISPADGPRSPSYPTGSQYGRQVLQEEGLFWGVLMTSDRLFHEADVPLGPMIDLHQRLRFYDPPLFNRYWRDPVQP